MADEVMILFEEYASSFQRGERPDLRAFLAQAGAARNELALLVDAWLQVAPAPEPDEEAIEQTRAWLEGAAPRLAAAPRAGFAERRWWAR